MLDLRVELVVWDNWLKLSIAKKLDSTPSALASVAQRNKLLAFSVIFSKSGCISNSVKMQ